MYELVKLFFEICLFKKGPEDIPASPWLVRLLIVAYVFINFILLKLSSDSYSAFFQVIVEVLLILGSSWVILFMARRSLRFQQTASALIATDAVISFFALPAMATLASQESVLAIITVMLLMLWHWFITGHIFSRALGQPFTFGLGVAFLYILVAYQVLGLVFPELLVVE